MNLALVDATKRNFFSFINEITSNAFITRNHLILRGAKYGRAVGVIKGEINRGGGHESGWWKETVSFNVAFGNYSG